MAKFAFSLESVLKLRSFKEKRVIHELAEIVGEIEKVKEDIKNIHLAIDHGYEEQGELKGGQLKGQSYSFFPYYFQGKREHLKNREALLYSLEKKYTRKIEELAKAKGEVKVIQNLKDKEIAKFKKERNKKIEGNREEMVILRSHLKKDGV